MRLDLCCAAAKNNNLAKALHTITQSDEAKAAFLFCSLPPGMENLMENLRTKTDLLEKYGVWLIKPSRFSFTSLTVSCDHSYLQIITPGFLCSYFYDLTAVSYRVPETRLRGVLKEAQFPLLSNPQGNRKQTESSNRRNTASSYQ